MDFKLAYNKMLEGKKIRRVGWKGYQYINNVTNKLTIHLANKKEITYSKDVGLTIANTLATDWEVVENNQYIINYDIEQLLNNPVIYHQLAKTPTLVLN